METRTNGVNKLNSAVSFCGL